ncbi:uroporphyrinogen-III C-methyltransferase [Alkalicoccus chagannorensis]|uniref:uroporphyrinogen-III C-methyltransferase n=1 Tax=Alkalicoccus chagannorensis TaxID=427072 RepID=UPI00047D2743|nr:uroporphyrinogen-III C-methyltransferase [Alkalicoccus chagannorensis]
MSRVMIVGAGPGDPELITVKGLRAIQEADVIFYDRLAAPELLQEAAPGTELVYCGKEPGRHSMSQEELNSRLILEAAKGRRVTRLKGGDPFIFGRGGEEADVLQQAGIAYDIVPGITSGAAVPAYAGIPVTHRDYASSVTFVAGVSKAQDSEYWRHAAKASDTLCIYMGIRSLPEITRHLIRHGRDGSTPAAVIQEGTTARQKTITGTLDTIAGKLHEVEQPAMVVIGDVVKLGEQLAWFEAAARPAEVVG